MNEKETKKTARGRAAGREGYSFSNLALETRNNTPQAKCDVHRIDVNAINNEKTTIAVYRILVMCDAHRI